MDEVMSGLNEKRTAIYEQHVEMGGKMVGFAGYKMPLNYKLGAIAEHKWVRNNCGLFDVSHMGQVFVTGSDVADLFSYVTPSDFHNLHDGEAKYTVLLNDRGGIIDDIIVTKFTDREFYVVLNAGRKVIDMDYMRAIVEQKKLDVNFNYLESRSLIAIQGPKSVEVVAELIGDKVHDFKYMNAYKVQTLQGLDVIISRTGYTGEQGFEVSVNEGVELWSLLTKNEFVEPIGLGARDSLRLEVGYPLYGNDLNEDISPVEAALSWVIRKENLNFVGAERILSDKEQGVKQRRVGVKLLGKGIMRAGAEVFAADQVTKIGTLSSGGFSPSLDMSIGQAYLLKAYAKKGSEIYVSIRGKLLPAEVSSFIFYKA